MLAIKVLTFNQGDTTLYVTSLPTRELLRRAKVDWWSPHNPEGYQRRLVPKRVSEGAWYLVEGGTLPASIVLSIRNNINILEESGGDGPRIGTLHLPDDEPLWVVDGQHRIAYLEEAIRRGERALEDYQVPVTILLTPTISEEMGTFYAINAKAKNMPTDIADRMLHRRHDKQNSRLLAPRKTRGRKLERPALQARAVNILDHLREHCPVWMNMVELPGEIKPNRHAVKQHTVVMALVEGPLKHPSVAQLHDEVIADLHHRYWSAIAEIFPEAFKNPDDYSIQRTPGLYSLERIFPDVLERCREDAEYSQEKMAGILRHLHLDSDFWHKDPQTGDYRTFGTGVKSLRLLSDYLKDRLPPLTLRGM